MHIPNQVSNTLRQIPTADLIDVFCNEIHRRQRLLSQNRCAACGELLSRHERTACFLDGQKLKPEDFHVDVVVTVAIKPGEWDSLFHRVGRQMTSLGRMKQGERSISREPLSDCPDCIVAYYRGERLPYCNAHLPEQYRKSESEAEDIHNTPRATAQDFEAANATPHEIIEAVVASTHIHYADKAEARCAVCDGGLRYSRLHSDWFHTGQLTNRYHPHPGQPIAESITEPPGFESQAKKEGI